MKPPFTIEQFLQVFKNYNLAIFPMQIIFYLLAATVIYFSIKKSSASDKMINVTLSFFWIWMGIVYHIIYFSVINKVAILFGTVFIIQGLLFLYFGVFKSVLSYKFESNRYGITGAIIIAFALLFYPVLGYIIGHVYPTSPTFGLPCPTTIFTFGLLLWSAKKLPLTILIIPFLWSIVGFFAAFSLGIFEDSGLPIAGLTSIVMVLVHNKELKSSALLNLVNRSKNR